MIISEATNEPPLHIWNTNNLTLKQKWQARLVIGRGLLLVACCYWTSAKINPDWITLTQSIWGNAFRTKWETSTCQYLECWNQSPKEFASLHTFPDRTDCSATFCPYITYSVSGNMMIKWYSKNHAMHYNENTHTNLIISVVEILTVLILCVFHHAWIFCWKQRKILTETIKTILLLLSDSVNEQETHTYIQG